MALAVAAAAVVFSRPAWAAQPPRPDYPTDAIVPHVPAGWKMATLQGAPGYQELGEFTPTGEPTDLFTDLVGYTRVALPPNTQGQFKVDQLRAGLGEKCSDSAVLELTPPRAAPGWI
jgi:hypothetical protein